MGELEKAAAHCIKKQEPRNWGQGDDLGMMSF